MSGTDATGIPARDGDGNTIPPPIAPAPVNPVAPPAPPAQDVSDTVILTAIGTLTSALGEMAPAPRTPGIRMRLQEWISSAVPHWKKEMIAKLSW